MMWELFDALIEGIPAKARADFVCRGLWQAYVESGKTAGLSSLLLPGKVPFSENRIWEEYRDCSLRTLAAGMKSFDPLKSALGVAACNAWYNDRARLAGLHTELFDPESNEGDVFLSLRERCRGKLVSVVGHFMGAAALEGVAREIRVFEREPREGDYPDAAEEYLLPGSDVVIITGMTLTNKTLPRLLELAGDAFTALTGPSVPMTPLLFRYGADALYGMTVWDLPGCRESILTGEHKGLWRHVGKAVLCR